MIQSYPSFSDSYVFGLEFIFEQSVLGKYPDAYIQFTESNMGMSLEISVGNKKIYDRLTTIPGKRRCIENFFDDMIKKSL